MTSLSTLPYAILPSLSQQTNIDFNDNENTNNIHRTILFLFENKTFEWNMFKNHPNSWCIGSSHNFLVCLNNKGCPFLLNPSSNTFINLPPFPNSLIQRAHVPSYSYFVHYLRKTFISKAVLMDSPSTTEYTIAIMYNYPLSKISFFNNYNDNASWVDLVDANRCYSDIVFEKNHLYALVDDGSIEGWDFRHRVPKKILNVYSPTFEIDELNKFPCDKFSTQFYLVISKGKFLLIERVIGNFVNGDGEVVYEGDSLSNEGEICPYRTKHFNVYKLVMKNNKWVKINNLDGGIVFLGVNESKLVENGFGCEGNLIYFSDDRWEEMNLDYLYGGHDWGVFNLQDSSVKLLTPYADKMDPPPVWMIPNSN